MATNYDSLIDINDNKSKWCCFAKIVMLWHQLIWRTLRNHWPSIWF